HLKVVGLISNEAWHGDQAQWTFNNAELNTNGTGDNTYIQNFATNAAGVLANHFVGRISAWEVWNEPNAYSTSGPAPGEFSGSSFIYPSNFAWLQKRSYTAIKAAQPGAASVVISGGLFGSDIGGAALTLVVPGGARQIITRNSGSGASRAAAGGTCAS